MHLDVSDARDHGAVMTPTAPPGWAAPIRPKKNGALSRCAAATKTIFIAGREFAVVIQLDDPQRLALFERIAVGYLDVIRTAGRTLLLYEVADGRH